MTESSIGVVVEPEATSEERPPAARRFVDRIDPRLVTVLTVVGFGAPLATYLWVVHRYSLNVIIGDQWDDLVVIGHSYQHLFDWSSLWAQHNENRILFPNLIVLLLAHLAHYNVRLEEYLSALFLIAAVVFVIAAHRRRAPSNPWLYYCPVALLALSIVQYENTLWGFQMAWYLVMLSLAVALFLLDRPTLTWIAFLGASAATVVGSFSSIQGLLIWPAGLVLLYHRRRPRHYVVTWLALAVASAVIYFYNFNVDTTSHRQYVWHHPLAAARFYIYALGDIVGVRGSITAPRTGNLAILLLGVVILLLALFTLVAYGVRRAPTGGVPSASPSSVSVSSSSPSSRWAEGSSATTAPPSPATRRSISWFPSGSTWHFSSGPRSAGASGGTAGSRIEMAWCGMPAVGLPPIRYRLLDGRSPLWSSSRSGSASTTGPRAFSGRMPPRWRRRGCSGTSIMRQAARSSTI